MYGAPGKCTVSNTSVEGRYGWGLDIVYEHSNGFSDTRTHLQANTRENYLSDEY